MHDGDRAAANVLYDQILPKPSRVQCCICALNPLRQPLLIGVVRIQQAQAISCDLHQGGLRVSVWLLSFLFAFELFGLALELRHGLGLRPGLALRFLGRGGSDDGFAKSGSNVQSTKRKKVSLCMIARAPSTSKRSVWKSLADQGVPRSL
eukprot:764280-Pyramimonas_sp.AAC.1